MFVAMFVNYFLFVHLFFFLKKTKQNNTIIICKLSPG